MLCTSTGTLNITPLDSLSTVFEGASQEYEFSSEESEGEENNREVEDDPPDSSSPEGRVKCEGENPGYESSSEESVGETRTSDSHLQILPVPPDGPPGAYPADSSPPYLLFLPLLLL
jgi:hypothetical protein